MGEQYPGVSSVKNTLTAVVFFIGIPAIFSLLSHQDNGGLFNAGRDAYPLTTVIIPVAHLVGLGLLWWLHYAYTFVHPRVQQVLYYTWLVWTLLVMLGYSLYAAL